jgi:hypothetical protein
MLSPPAELSRGVVDVSETVIGTLLAAAIASLGYVIKLLVQEWREWSVRRATRLSRLLALNALLHASKTAFIVQNDLARELSAKISRSEVEQPADNSSFDELFTLSYGNLTPGQADDHRVIRGYTQHALRPINEEMSTWLRNDTDYKFVPRRRWRWRTNNRANAEVQLAESLAALEAHLLLWHAKYAAWIPDQPAHALVYLDDEKRHGLGFPHRVEDDVAAVINAHVSASKRGAQRRRT